MVRHATAWWAERQGKFKRAHVFQFMHVYAHLVINARFFFFSHAHVLKCSVAEPNSGCVFAKFDNCDDSYSFPKCA